MPIPCVYRWAGFNLKHTWQIRELPARQIHYVQFHLLISLKVEESSTLFR